MKFSKPNNNPFYNGLKLAIDQYFITHKLTTKGNGALLFKGILLLLLYLLSYVSIFRSSISFVEMLAAYIVIGLTGVMVVFNIVHDASHMAISKKRWVNNMVCLIGDLVGINTHIWDIRHNIQHHSFTNVLGGDLIIENIPLIRLSPHQPYKKFHKYQPYYAPLLYMFYSFYWMFFIDFKLFFQKDICNLHNIKHSRKHWAILVAFKSFYLFYSIIVPWYFTTFSFGQILLCFMIMHMVAGLLLSFVAVMGHFVEGPSFPISENGRIHNSWSEHELEATIDFAPKSRIVHWITGGLNTHVAHHLFPNICHVHYYNMTKIIEEYCKKGNFQYMHESLLGGLKSHFIYLKRLSKPQHEALNHWCGAMQISHAKALKEYQIAYEDVEAEGTLGGYWSHGVYETVYTDACKDVMQFPENLWPCTRNSGLLNNLAKHHRFIH